MDQEKETGDFENEMEETILEFSLANGYQCRIIPKAGEEVLEDYIEDIHYEDTSFTIGMDAEEYSQWINNMVASAQQDYRDYYDGNDIYTDCLKMLRSQYGSDGKSPSWLLARLWQLTKGGILKACENVNETGEGFGDCGDYYGCLLVEKDNQSLAVLCFQGNAEMEIFTTKIRKYSEKVTMEVMEQIYQSFAITLFQEPKEIAICKITVEDPEKHGFTWEYGWDGYQLLRSSEQGVLKWYQKDGRHELGQMVQEALKQVETHPIHHLERRYREQISQSLSRYIRIYLAPKISFEVFRMGLELEVMNRAAAIWQNTWRDETKLSDSINKIRELIGEADSVKRRKIMAELEESWSYLKNWMEQTTIRDLNHKIHRFPASLAGYCVIQGAYQINYELERYWEVIEKWKQLRSNGLFPDFVEIESIQNQLEELVKEQDSTLNFKDSWGETGEQDIPEDFYKEDMYFYAACTCVGGLPYHKEGYDIGDKEKFKQFWHWWLLEAIPICMP